MFYLNLNPVGKHDLIISKGINSFRSPMLADDLYTRYQ